MPRCPKAKLPFNDFNLPKRLSPPGHDSANRWFRPVQGCHMDPVVDVVVVVVAAAASTIQCQQPAWQH